MTATPRWNDRPQTLASRRRADQATRSTHRIERSGHRAVAYTLARAGIPYTTDEIHFLVAQIERLKPFPDVPEALARLQTRYKVVVLSNGDPDMLETAKSFHKIPFDAVISVAVAGSFKPHVATYTKAEIIGVRMDEVLFVANHPFDCIGAKSAGMHSAFSTVARCPSAAPRISRTSSYRT